MRLSELLDLFTGSEAAAEDKLGLEAASTHMVLLTAHDQNEPGYIAGTSSELYASHDFRDLGVWFDNPDDEAE